MTKRTQLACFIAAFAAASALAGDTALTIYTQGFGTIRESIPLDLKAGTNSIVYDRATVGIEPESVTLRDPAGLAKFAIREQQFRRDWPTTDRLLERYEGKTIQFEIRDAKNGEMHLVDGKIISAGNFPTAPGETVYNDHEFSRAIVEMEGQVRLGLPGVPRFPKIDESFVFRPTLAWQIEAEVPARLNAEISYLTDGIRWDADYNLIAPENGDTAMVSAWVTIQNLTGRAFEKAKVKLVAGDVRRMRRLPNSESAVYAAADATGLLGRRIFEKTFEDYHLYSVPFAVTLRESETKQIELLQSPKVVTKRLYVLDPYDSENVFDPSDPVRTMKPQLKVAVFREFTNTAENGLGIALPWGRVRFYRSDSDGLLEFTGGAFIDHTPVNETVRVKTGNAFDLIGSRKITLAQDGVEEQANNRKGGAAKGAVAKTVNADRGIEIVLRNSKKNSAEVHVVEHLEKDANWSIISKSDEFQKRDAATIEFTVSVPAGGEKKIEYMVRYSRSAAVQPAQIPGL